MKLRPLDDRIVVKPLDAEEKTAGGIVLPDSAKEKPQRDGRVRMMRFLASFTITLWPVLAGTNPIPCHSGITSPTSLQNPST